MIFFSLGSIFFKFSEFSEFYILIFILNEFYLFRFVFFGFYFLKFPKKSGLYFFGDFLNFLNSIFLDFIFSLDFLRFLNFLNSIFLVFLFT